MKRLVVVLVLVVTSLVVVPVGEGAATPPDPRRDLCLGFVDVCALDVLAGLVPSVGVVRDAFGVLAGPAGALAGGVVASTVGWFADSLAAGTRQVWGEVSGVLVSSTSTPVSVGVFPSGPYRTLVQIAAGLLVVFVLVAVIHALVTGVLAEVWLRLVAHIPFAVLAIGFTPWVTDQVAGLVDGICAALVPSPEVLSRFGSLVVSSPRDAFGVGIPALLGAAVVFVAAAVIYLELVVRNALLVATVALSPLTFAAMVWPAARPAARKVVELLVAVLVSKVATMVVLAVGVDLAVRRDPSAGGFGQLITAVAVLVVAVAAPWITWRLLPVAEAAVIGVGVSRAPVQAGRQAAQLAFTRALPTGGPPAGSAASTAGAGGGGVRDPGPGPVVNDVRIPGRLR